jgi:hypothetical protein
MNKVALSSLVERAERELINALNTKNNALLELADAKIQLLRAQTRATNDPGWKACPNDKTRDAYVRENYSSYFEDVEEAIEEDRLADLKKDIAETNLSCARLQVQIWTSDLPE